MGVEKSKIIELETMKVTCPRKTLSNLGFYNTLHFPTCVVFEGFLSRDKTVQNLSANS